MKKFALLFLTFLTLWSCGDEMEFSTPGFQGNKNYDIWRATSYNGVLSGGNLIITAGNNNEQMMFTLPSTNATSYLLTDASAAKADFTDFDGIEYSTLNPPDPSVSLYPEIGEIVITESTGAYVSGSFRFIAFTEDGLLSVGFNEGVFYRIPIGNGTTTGDTADCGLATTNMATASANFVEVVPGDDLYVTRCNAYKTALQQMISVCGDTSGALQIMLDNLGDCN